MSDESMREIYSKPLLVQNCTIRGLPSKLYAYAMQQPLVVTSLNQLPNPIPELQDA